MATTKRKSATKTAARERARAAAAAQIEREERLLQAAESFFAETLDLENKKDAVREKIAQLEEELKALDAPAEGAAQFVQQMKAEGLKNGEIAERLELSASDVGRYLKQGASKNATAAPTPDASEGAEAGEATVSSEKEPLPADVAAE